MTLIDPTVAPDQAKYDVDFVLKMFAAMAIEGLLPGAVVPKVAGTAVTRYAARLNALGTTTVTGATAYPSVLVIATEAAGTACTITIKNKEATPKVLYTATLAVGTVSLNISDPILMTSGIDITLAGTTVGIANVFMDYWQ